MEHRLTAVNGTKDPVPGVLYLLKSETSPEKFSALWKAMSASRTIPSWSLTITPHIETVCANNTRICPTNSAKRASNPLYPGSMVSNSISASVSLHVPQ